MLVLVKAVLIVSKNRTLQGMHCMQTNLVLLSRVYHKACVAVAICIFRYLVRHLRIPKTCVIFKLRDAKHFISAQHVKLGCGLIVNRQQSRSFDHWTFGIKSVLYLPHKIFVIILLLDDTLSEARYPTKDRVICLV